MKLFAFSCLLSFSLGLSAQDSIADLLDKDIKKSPVQTCKIEYIVDGDAKGKATRYIDDWGWSERFEKEITYSQFGITNTEQKIVFRKGLMVYDVDPGKNKGKKSKDRISKDLLSYKTLEETKDALYKDQGGKKSGTENHLGKEVTIWKFNKGTTNELWEWKGLVLKEIKEIGKMRYTLSATQISYDPLDRSLFEIPEGITLTQE